MPTSIKIFLWSFAGFVAVTAGVYIFWWGRSRFQVWRARSKPLRALRASMWHDPGRVETLDLRAGPGGADGAPAPPFKFIEEHATGSNPCLSLRDARGRTWRVKWGDEVRSETFATRLVWAAGFHVEQAYFVPEGHIEGATSLGRAATCVDDDCTFRDARFELDEKGVRKLFDEHGWSWDDNPFVGTRELAGLKIMLMLTSNWDNKDVRDVARGSNTAIFEHRTPEGTYEARYLIIDWGASMGRWGAPIIRSKWDAAGYEEQTPELVAGVTDEGVVEWGYIGQRTDEAREGITVEDVRWLHGFVARLTDEQLREALRASGATDEEVETFTRAIRARIDKLGEVTG
ncbi:MAG TPA: hypothetical protein VFX96_14820 [Pyrinomonadaceae bacterium]|nr:hypothetical protein [Pyrinomonadaceae bacterium]